MLLSKTAIPDPWFSIAVRSLCQSKRFSDREGWGTLALATDTRLADKLVVIKELVADHVDPAEMCGISNGKCKPYRTLTTR